MAHYQVLIDDMQQFLEAQSRPTVQDIERWKRAVNDLMHRAEVGVDSPPQAFMDAVCNTHHKAIKYGSMDEIVRVEVLSRHEGVRYRGIEGSNGVACDACKWRARAIWDDYLRILNK